MASDAVDLLSFSLTFRVSGEINGNTVERFVRREIQQLTQATDGNRTSQTPINPSSRQTAETCGTVTLKEKTPDGKSLPSWLRKPVDVISVTSAESPSSYGCSTQNNSLRSSVMGHDVEKTVQVKCRIYMGTDHATNQPWICRITFELGNTKTMVDVLTTALSDPKLMLTEGFYKFRVFKTDEEYNNPEEVLYSRFKDSSLFEAFQGSPIHRSHRMIIDLTRKSVGGLMPRGFQSWRAYVKFGKDDNFQKEQIKS